MFTDDPLVIKTAANCGSHHECAVKHSPSTVTSLQTPSTMPPAPNSKFLSTHTFSSAHTVVKHREISPQGFDQTTRGPHLAAQDWLQPGGEREQPYGKEPKKNLFSYQFIEWWIFQHLHFRKTLPLCASFFFFFLNLLLDCEMFNQEFSFGSL